MLEPGALPGPLGAAELRGLLQSNPPLAAGLEDPELQVQPHGLDLRVDQVWATNGVGRLGRVERQLPPRRELTFDADGWLQLAPGGYVVRFAERVALPTDLMALGFTRSSLLRAGCAVFGAVWDAGYEGHGEALLLVQNPAGLALQRGARIVQLVFFRLATPTERYRGVYQEAERTS